MILNEVDCEEWSSDSIRFSSIGMLNVETLKDLRYDQRSKVKLTAMRNVQINQIPLQFRHSVWIAS